MSDLRFIQNVKLKWAQYSGQSKTGDNLFAIELAKKYGDKGLTAFSLHVSFVGSSCDRRR